MQFRTLGRTGLNVSLVSLGTGGPSRLGQRTHSDEAASHKVVHRALDLGVNLIDSAAAYGDSEAILCRALAGVPRDKYYLATKFTPDPNENGEIISPKDLVESCDRSLKRLNVDCIDIYQFHGLVPSNYREAVDTLYPTVEKLQSEGKIRFIGVTEYFFYDADHQMLVRALEDDIWDTIMVKYGILNLSAEWKVFPLAREKNVGVMNMSAVRVKMTRPAELEKTIKTWKNDGLIDKDALPDQDALGFLVHDEVKSVVAAGYKVGIADDAIATCIIGTGNVQHLEENIDTICGPPLHEADLARIREVFGSIAESEGDTG